jgi:acetoacetate decarboxylase
LAEDTAAVADEVAVVVAAEPERLVAVPPTVWDPPEVAVASVVPEPLEADEPWVASWELVDVALGTEVGWEVGGGCED